MKKVSFLFLLAVLFLIPIVIYGNGSACPDCSKPGGLVPCGRTCDDPTTSKNECDPCTICDFFVMIERYINGLLFMIVPPLAALIIAIGGGMYIFSRGDPEMLSRAKKLFASVGIGLLIIYGAWLIVNVFFMFIGVADWTGLREGWWQINCP